MIAFDRIEVINEKNEHFSKKGFVIKVVGLRVKVQLDDEKYPNTFWLEEVR